MAGNSFGTLFRLTTFGESHGLALGGIIDGCPAGMTVDLNAVQAELDRRKPGQSKVTTGRKESDKLEILSGLFEGKTLGTPIGFVIRNEDQHPKDYSDLKNVYRPSHADYTWEQKFGIRDHRGGGRASARETACRVVAGAFAKQLIGHYGVQIIAYVSAIGRLEIGDEAMDFDSIENSLVRCPSPSISKKMENHLLELKEKGESAGGVITCKVTDSPVGLGEPVFDKLHAQLAKAIFSINAVKGLEFGSGFEGSKSFGSEHNDAFVLSNEKVQTKTNNSGGIQGGISNGSEITMRVAFKPVATVGLPQQSVDNLGNEVEIKAKGRHDPCVVPRAVPIVESMVALVMADMLLLSRSNKL